MDQFFEEEKCDIVIPVEANHHGGKVLGFDYLELLNLDSLYFASKRKDKDQAEILQNLATSTLETWPLFVIAMTMAFCAGSFIWIMVR